MNKIKNMLKKKCPDCANLLKNMVLISVLR